jgi:iron complex transport system ATP-binding protein
LRDAVVVRDGSTILDVDELSFWPGEHVAVLGPNGAGKSTLIDVITRETRPLATDEGALEMLGQSRWDLFEARDHLGMVSPSLTRRHSRRVTVRETVLSGFFGSVAVPPRREIAPQMESRAQELMSSLGIVDLAERTMSTLSTGEARRALIGRALAHDPEALILDEPCDGLDPKARAEFIQTMRSLAAEGHTLILVTHHVADIIPEVERVILLKQGRIAADGSASEVLTSERLSDLFEMQIELAEKKGFYSIAE